MKIDKNTKLDDIPKTEETIKILSKYGVPCIGCGLFAVESEFLTIEAVSDAYGLDADSLIKELNKALEKSPQPGVEPGSRE